MTPIRLSGAPGLVIDQLAGNEIAAIRHHHQAAVGADEAEAGEAAEGIDRALHLDAAAPDQALHRLADSWPT